MTLNGLRCYHMLCFSTNYFFENQLFIAIFQFCIFQLSPILVYCNIPDFSQWAKNTKRYISLYLIFFSAACVWDFGFPSSITQMLPASLFLQGILLILQNTWLQRAQLRNGTCDPLMPLKRPPVTGSHNHILQFCYCGQSGNSESQAHLTIYESKLQ